MTKDKIPVTPCILKFRQHGISFDLRPYRYEEHGGTRVSAQELNVDEHMVIKTLVMEDEKKAPCIVLMHGDRQVSTKALARVLEVKSIAPCDPKVAEKHTGYKVGGTSPLGTRKPLKIYMEESIASLPRILINGEAGKPFGAFLNSGVAVTMKFINLIMYYAPIGLGAYFANMVGQLGSQILTGYIKVFILYLVVSIIYYFVFFTLYAYIGGKQNGVKLFWQNAIKPSITAIATCSSAACIPVNIEASKRMGVSSTLANIIMPIGVNIHKDGSVIGGIYKIMFLLTIFGNDINSIGSLIKILCAGLLIGAVVGAIPGGGAIGEMLILSIFGFPQGALAVMLVIATIIDVPATLLNSTGNTVCTMIISRFVEKQVKLDSGGV